VGILSGLLLGSALLHGGSETGLWSFAWLFVIAAASRYASGHLLNSQTEPDAACDTHTELGLGQAIGQLRGTSGFGLLVYLLAVQVSVYTAAPYFTPFMLSELQLTYVQFVTLVALGFVGKVLALAGFGKYAERAGARRLLWIGGLGIVPLSGLWALGDSVLYLAVLQILGGVLWAAYELAVFLLFFEAIPRRTRTSLLTIYNVCNSAAMVGGGLLGACFLAWYDAGRSTYLALFVVSSLARAATIVLLARLPKSGHENPHLGTRTIALRPSMATIEQPLLVTCGSNEAAQRRE
jgi:MFS family permease